MRGLTRFALAIVVAALAAIALFHTWKERQVNDQTWAQYQRLAEGTRSYLEHVEQKAVQATELLARFPHLLVPRNYGVWVHPDVPALFANVMRTNEVFYAIYLGFADGTFYELVNLEASPVIRAQIRALPEDRWVVIEVTGYDTERTRTFRYLNQHFEERSSHTESSAYDASKRLWFTQAVTEKVTRTPPYQFMHLQSPGQTYSIRLADNHSVLAVDIALSTVSDYLGQQLPKARGEIYLFRPEGQILASNQMEIYAHMPNEREAMTLTPEEQKWIAELEPVRVSNEMDWPPVDYAVAGEPSGYMIDLLRTISRRTGIRFEFVNGYTWTELVDLFTDHQIDLLQPISKTALNESRGKISVPVMQLRRSVVTRVDTPAIASISDLDGTRVAMPSGWSSIQILRENYPNITILETGNMKEALEAVRDGEADATFDVDVVLRHTIDQYFIDGVMMHPNVRFDEMGATENLYMLASHADGQLLDILNRAVETLPVNVRRQIEHKWFRTVPDVNATAGPAVVPYRELQNIVATTATWPSTYPQIMPLGGREYMVCLAPLREDGQGSDYLALLFPAHTVLQPIREETMDSLQTLGLGSLATWLVAGIALRWRRRSRL